MASSSTVPAVYRLTFEDWLRLPEDVGRAYEILGGELFVSPTPTTRHQRIVRNLLIALELYLRTTALGECLAAPTGVKLSEEDILQPDLLVVLAEHRHRIEPACVVGPPDLVVEVLSPGNAGRDLRDKHELYESAGVSEYWIVDPAAESIEVLALGPKGPYRSAGRFGRRDTLTSQLLSELALPLAEVFPAA